MQELNSTVDWAQVSSAPQYYFLNSNVYNSFSRLIIILLSVFGFNVVTQLWSDLPRFTKDRGYHSITSFGGQLYVTGGYCNVNSETLDLGNGHAEYFNL